MALAIRSRRSEDRPTSSGFATGPAAAMTRGAPGGFDLGCVGVCDWTRPTRNISQTKTTKPWTHRFLMTTPSLFAYRIRTVIRITNASFQGWRRKCTPRKVILKHSADCHRLGYDVRGFARLE